MSKNKHNIPQEADIIDFLKETKTEAITERLVRLIVKKERDAIKKTQKEIEEAIPKALEEIKRLKTELSNANTEAKKLKIKAAIAEFETKELKIKATIDNIEKTNQKTPKNNEIKNLSEDIKELTKDIEELRGNVKDLTGDTSKNNETINPIKHQNPITNINEARTTLTQLKDTITSLKDTITSLKTINQTTTVATEINIENELNAAINTITTNEEAIKETLENIIRSSIKTQEIRIINNQQEIAIKTGLYELIFNQRTIANSQFQEIKSQLEKNTYHLKEASSRILFIIIITILIYTGKFILFLSQSHTH